MDASELRLRSVLLIACCFLLQLTKDVGVLGHGRLMDPPARNSMWRFGFPNPVNYNDNELYCGGFSVQWVQNEGRCGVCGDAHHLEQPRPHEAGGKYARGTIVRRYQVGQEIDVEVELTSNHQGHFEMYICPNNNPNVEATQDCFYRYPLYLSGTQEVRYVIPPDSDKKGIFRYKVSLPPYLTCTQCVLQWTYYTANMWGTCDNGTEAVGCGQPETFRNCADISILTSASGLPPTFVQRVDPSHHYGGYKDYYGGYKNYHGAHNDYHGAHNDYYGAYKDYNDARYYFPFIGRSQVCVPSNDYRDVPGMNEWCQSNCLRHPPNCPQSHCICLETCEAVGEISGRDGADEYCLDQCLVYPSRCPSKRCRCY